MDNIQDLVFIKPLTQYVIKKKKIVFRIILEENPISFNLTLSFEYVNDLNGL